VSFVFFAEWLSFYEKSLKDAVLSDCMDQLEKMHDAVAEQKASKSSVSSIHVLLLADLW
jgi:hypothetical protein